MFILILSKKIFAASVQLNFLEKFKQSSRLILSAFNADFFKSIFKVSILVPPKISFGPGTGYAATGVPQLSDSKITIPKVSVLLGKTKTSEEVKYYANSPLVLSPRNISFGNFF